MKLICKICGNTFEEHHKPYYIKVPDSCVCDFRTWDLDTIKKIKEPCDKFEGKYNCDNCEHDKECHVKTDSTDSNK